VRNSFILFVFSRSAQKKRKKLVVARENTKVVKERLSNTVWLTYRFSVA
jgi:hypothetical protein